QIHSSQGTLWLSGNPLRLQKIETAFIKVKSFKYSERGNLERVVSGAQHWRYLYDGNDNLMSCRDESGQFTRVTYDSQRDVVATLKRSDGCEIKMEYPEDRKPATVGESNVKPWIRRIEKSCPNQEIKVFE